MRLHCIVVLALVLSACTEDGSATEDGEAGTGSNDTGADTDGTGGTGGPDGSDSGDPGMCSDTSEDEFFYPPPGDCYNNAGCGTCNCLTWQDNPPLMEAMCVEAGPGMRITATLFTFPDQTPVPDTLLEIVPAFEIAIQGPENATRIAETTSDASGRIDLSIDEPTDQIGIVAIVTADGYRDTATGLAKPESMGYEPSNAIHDLFVVPEQLLGEWSTELGKDAGLQEHLPLGDQGGVVGIARSRYTGEPMADIQIVPLAEGSPAIVRYLNEDGTFNDQGTTSTGVYVVLAPDLAEEFEAQQGGVVVSTRPNKAGSGPPGIFTMNLTIDTDPGMNPFE